MPAAIPAVPDARSTSIQEKLLNVLVYPSEVFEEIADAPTDHENWRVPTLLVCLTGMILLGAMTTEDQTAATIRHLIETGASQTQSEQAAGNWNVASRLVVCLGAFAGTAWSAFVLWFIGRVFLKVRFPFLKALEVAGLTGAILALESLMTLLLVVAADDTSARPALSLLLVKSTAAGKIQAALGLSNVFYLWMTATLAIGLSKLSGVSFKEAAFWVFGYWIALRLALIILG